MGRHDSTPLTNARDELMSHIVRCGALHASMEDRMEWLDETMDYMADRYPRLDDLKLAQLELMGRQYLKPVIPHGKEHTAITMDRSKPQKPETEAVNTPDTPFEPAGAESEPELAEAQAA